MTPPFNVVSKRIVSTVKTSSTTTPATFLLTKCCHPPHPANRSLSSRALLNRCHNSIATTSSSVIPIPSTKKHVPHQPHIIHSLSGSIRQLSTTSSTTEPTTPTKLSYATVDHSEAYEEQMAGRHGQQLALAYKEGEGKDVKLYPHVPEDDWDNIDDYFNDEMDFNDDDDTAQEGDTEGADNDDSDDDEDYDDDDDDDLKQTYIEINKDPSKLNPDQTYRANGFPIRPPSEIASLRAGAPANGVFAVIALHGFQHKVTVHDLIIANKLRPVSEWAVGTTKTLSAEYILAMGDQRRTHVGLPYVGDGAEVDVMVEEITRDAKIVVFKKRRRKNSKRKKGYRREVTFLRVLDIRMPQSQGVEESGTKVEEAQAA